ncbi:MAG: FAD-dependent oxidoreductase, partial [Alphaproteobacteria bacterium]
MTGTTQDLMPPSLWAATAPRGAPHHALEGTRDVDRAIVGAGFTGLATALFARRLGLSGAVLEAVEGGFGASGRYNGPGIPAVARR